MFHEAARASGHLGPIADYDVGSGAVCRCGRARRDRRCDKTQLERAKRALAWDGQRLNAYRQHIRDDEQSRRNLQILTAVFYASLDYVWELQTRSANC
jgi:hypothetical protein